MSRSEVMAALQELFRELFDDGSITLTDATTAADIDGWDSLEHVNLIVTVEKRFRVRFTMDEILSLQSVGDMADLVCEKT
ncbi:MAG: acyl carrier protein [Oscillospiraceae bacterium]|jgi:acyl carrier protein|nr:acyl carrier protein [Oscillospiraceae bacterium]